MEPEVAGPTSLTPQQQDDLVRDGFVVVRRAVVPERVARARERILAGMPATERRLLAPAELATHPEVVGLFRESRLAGILRDAMGPFPDVVSCQIAVTPGFDMLGGGVGAHVDGSWSGPIPTRAADIDPERGRPRDAARYFGEHDERRGTNDGLLWSEWGFVGTPPLPSSAGP